MLATNETQSARATHQQEQFDSGYMDAAAHGRESE
jgi:hypothetical protein